jgi:hypothetical protein
MTSNFLSTPAGNEQPFKFVLAATTVTTLVTAGDNGARVTLVRIAETAGTLATVRLEIWNGTTAYIIKGAKALTAHEVYKDFDIRLLKGEVLRAEASLTGVHITGLYVDISRGSA